jgi:hypothetical protein
MGLSQTNPNMLLEKAIRVRVERMLAGDMNPHEVALLFADQVKTPGKISRMVPRMWLTPRARARAELSEARLDPLQGVGDREL